LLDLNSFAPLTVIALDTSPTRLALARHNAAIYGVADRIEFILTDYLSFAHSFLSIPSQRRSRKIDVVFLSPPWGGPSYMFGSDVAELAAPSLTDSQASEHPTSTQGPEFSLASIQPIHGAELFKLSRQITPNISYYLPRNTSLEEISRLVEEENAEPLSLEGTTKEGYEDKSTSEMVEVEEEWMGLKLKALTCYFGGLVTGQEDLF
jgi:trimethylguanosine synthase